MSLTWGTGKKKVYMTHLIKQLIIDNFRWIREKGIISFRRHVKIDETRGVSEQYAFRTEIFLIDFESFRVQIDSSYCLNRCSERHRRLRGPQAETPAARESVDNTEHPP
jgi:hypothetical protein